MKQLCTFCILQLLLSLLLSSCKTPSHAYVEPQTAIKRDTVRVVHERLDSIFLHDSVYIRQTPETTYVERWHMRIKTQIKYRDSITTRVDSIPYPVTVIKREPYTPALTRYLSYIGIATILAIISAAILFFIKR